VENKTWKVAWGITGSGDKLKETYEAMLGIREEYDDIEVFLSKAGVQVAKYYKIEEGLRENFSRVWEEKNANSPFLASRLQLGEFAFLLLAPATSNTVAKLAHGISDTMLTNAAIQALKAYVPVYVMPTDFREGTTVTRLPDGRELRLRVRKEDAENVRRLEGMEGLTAFESPQEIRGIFSKRLDIDKPV
jgi:archaeoflavoprotein AfpA